MLVGWLFADLFLVLFMVALASVPHASLVAKAQPPKPTATPKPAPHPKPSQTKSASPGMANTPIDICVSQESSSIVADFDAQVKQKGMAGRKAGFILVFATGTDPGGAVTKASQTFKLIQSTDPNRVAFAHAGGEGLWSGASNSCTVNHGTDNYHFQVFFYL